MLTALRNENIRRYAQLIRPQAWLLSKIVVLCFVSAGLDMVWPLVSAYLIDRVIIDVRTPVQDRLWLLASVAALMVLVFTLAAVCSLRRTTWLQLLSSRLAFDVRSRLFQRVLRLPLSELSEMTTGGILSRLSTDVDNASGLVQQALIGPLVAGVRLLVTLCIIFHLNVQIATGVAIVVPPVLLLQWLHARRLRPIWRSVAEDRQRIDGRVGEGLGGVRVVRSFGREKLEELAYTVGHHTVIRKQQLATWVQSWIASLWDLIVPLAQLMVLAFGGYLVIQGKTTLGVVVAFQAYIWRLFDPVKQLATSISATQRGLSAIDRVFEVLSKPEEQSVATGMLPAPARVKELRFDVVSFEYRSGLPVIQDLSLAVKGGSVVALVGPSGAGKTTLTDLLGRFREPTSGAVRLNGIDVRRFDLRSYRRLIGIVSQDVFLFDGTIAENIAYGQPKAGPQEIATAARRANASEFIERLADGYETLVGERGVKLSGGQRQRLSIARALLADPEILILDEATSNLDTESEQLIHDSLRELLAERTTFVIAHRLSTIIDADLIVVLERGRAIEIGDHQELIQRRGVYHAMVQRQRPPEFVPQPAEAPPHMMPNLTMKN